LPKLRVESWARNDGRKQFVLTNYHGARYEALMWIALYIVGSLVALVVLLNLVGLLLPREQQAADRARARRRAARADQPHHRRQAAVRRPLVLRARADR
jgi:hypothetical protein